MLAGDLASITGVAFNDLDGDLAYEPLAGEAGIAGAEIRLTGVDDRGPIAARTARTGADGAYCFNNLRAGTYEVAQSAPAPVGYFPSTGASPRTVVVTAADAAGVPHASIDTFDGVEQLLTASAPANPQVSSAVADVKAIGGTRGMVAEATSATGIVTINSNAAFLPGVLEINPGSSGIGRYVVTWDGDLDPASLNPIGLRAGGVGRDLTEGGASTGIRMVLGVDKSGQSLTLRVYSDGANWSQAVVPLPNTGGGPDEEVFIPFSTGFAIGAGAGADFTNVGAIRLEIDAAVAAMDGQFECIGAIGPTYLAANLANTQARPAVHIKKSTNGQDADTPTGPCLAVGAVAAFEYVVTNPGNVPLSNVTITDDRGVTATFQGGDADGDRLLDAGETWTFHASATVTAGQYSNIGRVTANPTDPQGADLPGLADVSDSDPSHHFGALAAVQIEKSANGQDADTPTGPLLQVGSTVLFRYVVTNAGNVPLANVRVNDDQGLVVSYVGGDADSDSLLDVTETWTFQATATAITGPYSNVGDVIAHPVDNRGADIPGLAEVTDSDPSHYFGAATGIRIEKKINGQDADTAPGPFLTVGSTAVFQYVVTNAGNVSLANVQVSDDRGLVAGYVGGDADRDNLLDVGETWTYQAAATAVAGQYSNIGSVAANPVDDSGADIPTLADVADSDPSHYFGAAPGIDIEKATNGEDADTPTGPVVRVGAVVTFTYSVRNAGNVPLSSVVVRDDNGTSQDGRDDFLPAYLGGDDDGDSLLDVGEVWRYSASRTAAAGQHANTGTVSGVDPLQQHVTDEDLSHHFGDETPPPRPLDIPLVSKRRFLASSRRT